ncbi:endoplasmic oxidoreductin [Laetiporus sulphureus 93-53]|uniref:Endoplasmic oxidoreductin n=1 Tax=Laetiporus sulphureus 93-53 TaxID=1314785 RepID=A0A165F495_9APHY|nr:endoplasmic oxidoreductin [Laetiporus sulphureus 93-53]KZT08353.1 endoplasmic oxidoreductin [Laetiporus sulphureus 93-53]
MLRRRLHALSIVFLTYPFVAYATQSHPFLSDTVVQGDKVQNVMKHQPVKKPICDQYLTGPIETTLCNYENVESVNDELFSQLHALVETPFFKYFRVDLYRDCPFWEEDGTCANRECGITTVDESEIPEKWRAASLSKVEMPPDGQRTLLPGCYYRDSDYCFLDDMTEGEYVDLTLNPERFTGYIGPSAHRVWSSIYSENCFGLSEVNLHESTNPAAVSLPEHKADALPAEGVESPRECLEQRVYYKIISGLHTSISTHICHEMMNQSTGEWGPDLQCFINRVAAYPERLQFMYFDEVLLLRAIARLGPYLSAYDYCGTETHEGDAETLARLKKVIDIAQAVGKFDETALFRGENANILKEEFKEHFRNVTRIMDCVGCDKCRLWGKVQTTGIATALKVVFELDEKALDPRLNQNLLQRSEVVALINTLHRVSESLAAVNDFRKMWSGTDTQEEARLIKAAASTATSASKAQRSPVTGKQLAWSGKFMDDLVSWVRACKDGTVDCVHGLVDVFQSLLSAVMDIFALSGKGQGARSDL